jgi:ketosteroid isomerase-like protein
MKKAWIFITLMSFVVLVGGCTKNAKVGVQPELEADRIREVLSNSVSTLAKKDVANWVKNYVQDDSFTIINFGQEMKGFSTYRESITTFLKTASVVGQTHYDTKVYASGDVAWATYRETWTAKYADGRPDFVMNGLVTAGFVKRNGQWLIHHHHETNIQ